MKGGVVDSGEVAGAGRLVLFWAKGEGVYVDTSVWVSGVVLERLDEVEVGTFTLREAVLSVKLEFGGNNWVLTPAVHVEGGFGKNEGTSIRYVGFGGGGTSARIKVGLRVVPWSRVGSTAVPGTSKLEETRGINEGVVGARGGTSGNGIFTTEGVDGVGESIDGISVVERLGTKSSEKWLRALEGGAVINIFIRLYNPDELFDRVVEVKFDFVGGGTNGFITSELNLFDEVFVGVLGHASAFISVKEDVVNVEGGSYKRLIVGGGDFLGGAVTAGKCGYSPEALINRTDVEVDAYFVVLKSDEGKGKTRVSAVPELEWYVEGSLRESIAGSADLSRGAGFARTVYGREGRVGDEGKLGSVTDHFVVTAFLFFGHGKLVPDVHPVTVLSVDALTTDFNFNLGD